LISADNKAIRARGSDTPYILDLVITDSQCLSTIDASTFDSSKFSESWVFGTTEI